MRAHDVWNRTPVEARRVWLRRERRARNRHGQSANGFGKRTLNSPEIEVGFTPVKVCLTGERTETKILLRKLWSPRNGRKRVSFENAAFSFAFWRQIAELGDAKYSLAILLIGQFDSLQRFQEHLEAAAKGGDL